MPLAIFVFVSFFIASCSDSTSPNEGTVNVVSDMLNPAVSIVPSISTKNGIQVNEVDSIRVTSVRFLLSEMKLFSINTDSTEGRVLKSSPFVFLVDDTGTMVQLTSVSMPVGTYEKVKFEFHRFSASEAGQYATDAVLKDFATSDRYTMIITGDYYKGGVPIAFTFNSQATANLSLNFPSAITVEEGATTTVAIQVDPTLFFKKDGSILDPTNSKNTNDIENAIKTTIKAFKKS